MTTKDEHPKPIPNILKAEEIRCRIAIVVCFLLFLLELIALTSQILIAPDALVQEVGWKSYHMFTILANVFMGMLALMCIPFTLEGMRFHDYHLPRWFARLLYTGTTCLTITFLIALTVLSPMAGFYRMMLYSNNILFHLICPLISIYLFLFINHDHHLRFKDSLIAISPVILYSAVYLFMVFVIGEDAGGWRDHYQIERITAYLPLPVLAVLLYAVCLLIANLIRIPHNAIHARIKAAIETYYQSDAAYDRPTIQQAIAVLADYKRAHDTGGELIVPRRIITMMEKKYHSGLSTEELCSLYIHEYYRDKQEDSSL